ncbi:MAG: MFS transporter [Bifidobacterium breve]|nr:MFS transporter [Bifidobacterium breve]
MSARRIFPILLIAEGLCLSGMSVDLTITSLAGSSLAPAPWMATFPIACIFIGTVIGTPAMGRLVGRFGYRQVFVFGALLAVLGGISSATALRFHQFPLLCIGTFCVGIYQSGTNYYRYAAADSMPGKESKAINGILSAGAIASIIGPVLATFFGTATSIEYLPKIQSPTPSHMRDKAIASTTPNYPALLTRPRFVLGATISFVASFVMVLVMSGAPIVLESTFSQNAQTRMVAMQLHMVGMYLPTLFAIFIFHKKNSEMAQALTGLIVGMLGTVVALAASASYAVTLDLLLIGISWSLCYAAGSALLTKSYAESERSWARGVGELAPVLGQVLGSVLAGVLLAAGWKTVFVTVLAMIVCALIAMAGYRNKIKS